MNINTFVERAELVDLACKGSLLELSVCYRDVALLSIDKAPSNPVSTERPSPKQTGCITLETERTEG